MKLQVTVEYEDGNTQLVTVTPFTQVAFEREHGMSIAALATDQKITHMYWLAWHAATKGQGSFDEWLQNVAGVDGDSPGAAAPFPEAPSDGG